MKHTILSILLIFLISESLSISVSKTDGGLVVSTTESAQESEKNLDQNDNQVSPKIYSMEIRANISNRYAKTLVISKVRNLKNSSVDTTFSIILPENAFISEFIMEVGGKEYKAYVKEKEEAKRIYDEAVRSGQSAGHVELNPRDSQTFTVSVNVEPKSKTTFRLTYEELLQRELGQYELIVNIRPGQIVDDLSILVHINESRPLTFVRTPSLRTGNEINKNDENLKPLADVKIINSTAATVTFNPDKDQQQRFGGLLGGDKEKGFAGQFVVQYDVERDPQGGEVLVRDGYFVHFFSPSELQALPKHMVFVLDYSGSMMGRKIEQLTDAMQNILSELNTNDAFTMIRFTDEAFVWDVSENRFLPAKTRSGEYGHLESQLREQNLPEAVEATKGNIEKAKNILTDHGWMGSTNIIAGLEVGLFLIKKVQTKFPQKYQPMIVFLTDGEPNTGMYSTDEIIETVTKLNSGSNRASIFSLSFGYDANKEFLKKLSSENLGFSRHIFEAADASLQLQHFYKTISSPLLSNVTFKYVEGITNITQHHYPILFNGSELVVAGRINDSPNVSLSVDGICTTGLTKFVPVVKEPVGSLERLWAYLTVKQILKERETATNKTELSKRALDLSLKYSFVTAVSSLVVVKPNQTERTEPSTRPSVRADSFFARSLPITPMKYSHTPSGSPRRMSGMPGMPGISGAGYYPMIAQNSLQISAPLPKSLFVPQPQWRSNEDPDLDSFSGNIARTYYLPSSPPLPPPRTTLAPLLTTQSNIPRWLEDMRNNHQNVTTPQGSFMLGQSGDVTIHPQCPNIPSNTPGTGECTILFDCPQIFTLLTSVDVYLQYFCPLNEYAGVCCPISVVRID